MTDMIDFKKELDSYQARPHQFRIVKIPDLQYLMIDGHGDPNTSPMFADAVAALYPVATRARPHWTNCGTSCGKPVQQA